MKKFLLLSDVLFSTNSRLEQKRWYPPFLWLFSKINYKIAMKILAWFDRRSKKNLEKLLVAANNQRLDGLIGIGNYTIGTNEKGMISPECVQQFEQFRKAVHGRFLRWIPKAIFCWCPGNHDVGYKYDLPFFIKIGTKTGGPSAESTAKFKELFKSKLYDLVDFGNFYVLYISSVLIRNGENSDEDVAREAANQRKFLSEVLDGYEDQKPLFLVIHDPKAIEKSEDIQETIYRNKRKITGVIHGHMHSLLLKKCVWLGDSKYRKLCRNFKVVLALEPGGFFGIGGGFTTLSIDEDGSWVAKNHKL